MDKLGHVRRPFCAALALPALTLLLCLGILSTAPVRARADTVQRTDSVLGAVGGNVYITNPPSGDNGQYWHDGAWHNLSDIKDGAQHDLGNGWYVYWRGDLYGGGFQVWRSYEGTYGGETWTSPFRFRFNDIGYTGTGQHIDTIIDFDAIYAWKNNGQNLRWFSPFEITRDYSLLMAADPSDGGHVGVRTIYTTRLVEHGTDTLVDANNEFDVMYWDIDQPVWYHNGGVDLPDYTSEWREGVHKVSGYKDESIIGTNTTLAVSGDGTWLRSTMSDSSPTPSNQSTVIMKTGPQYTTEWRGYDCSTCIGYDSRVVRYPDWPAPTKSPREQVTSRGGTATFDITESFPFVAETNKAQSIVMADTLDGALDASRATVRVYKGDEDVTSNWTIDISGQVITATAKDTGHGYAEGEHTFRISAPVSETADLTDYERQDMYWSIPNQASVSINGSKKRTSSTHVLVPYEARGSVRLHATKTLTGRGLVAGQFAFQLKDQDGNVVDTATNDAAGTVMFRVLDYTQDDIGKTYTYSISEVPGSVEGYTYDMHEETVGVQVTDAGGGVLAVTAAYDTDGALFSNEYRTAPLCVVKQGANGGGEQNLAHAEFVLYRDDGDGVFDEEDTPATIYADAALAQEIPHARLTTDAEGRALCYGLVAGGTYWVKETKAPVGYSLDDEAHLIVVTSDAVLDTRDANGALAPLSLEDGVGTLVVVDTPTPVLPSMGSSGTIALFVVGGLLIGIGLVVFFLRPRGKMS